MTAKHQYLEGSPLFQLQSKSRLGKLLGLPAVQLKKLGENPLYSEWDEPKKSGGQRHIENPRKQLKAIQRKIAGLLMSIQPPGYLFCPVHGLSAFDNAKLHRGQRVVANIDIVSFFQNTPERRVYWFYSKYLGCSPDVAYILTQLSCFDGHLPTGSPLSPILSHFAHRDMWDEIERLAQNHNVKMSVWIDDLTLSGWTVTDAFLWKVKQQISKNGLRYHKVRKSVAAATRVTGTILKPDGSWVLPHRHFQKLHETTQKLKRNGQNLSKKDVEKLKGRIAGLKGQETLLKRHSD